MWELFPFPDEADLETYTNCYLKGVCIAGALVLVVLTFGVLIFGAFGHDKASGPRAHISDSIEFGRRGISSVPKVQRAVVDAVYALTGET